LGLSLMTSNLMTPSCAILLLSLFFSGCGIVGRDASVEILAPNNEVILTNLTARHYKSAEHCKHALKVIPKNLLASLESLSIEQKSQLTWPERLKHYTTKSCRSFKKRGEILSELNEIFSTKKSKVGIILPNSSSSEAALQIIISQIKTQLARSGYSAEKSLVIKRVSRDYNSALKAAAELVHLDRVAILIGGLTFSHASAIAQISDQSQTPALIVNAHAQLGRTRQTMRVYPPLKRLASRLATYFKENQIQTVAVVFPTGANIDLYHILRQELGGGYSYSQISYKPENPRSILNAVKSQASRLSNASGRPVMLILDNFRMVRHIVNILSTSLPSKKILFAGNQQWRSPALVIPKDDNLQGALFVDFIGNYRNLPNSIDTPISDNDYFTTAEAASKIDYQIIGHRLGSLAAEAARFGLDRHAIAKRLQSINNRWDSYFPRSESAFDAKRESSWPVFLFQVVDENIREI
jgi:hypothetical protein